VDHDASGYAVRAGVNAPDQPMSPGEIEAGPGVTGMFPAESFFDVFFEVDLPNLGSLYNVEPLLVENAGITCFPPHVVYVTQHTSPVSLLFKADDSQVPSRWHRGDRFGWLVLLGHGQNYDPGPVANKGGIRASADPFADFEQFVNSQPEVTDTATVVVDIHDVLTFTPPTSYTQPTYRDSLQSGLDQAAALGLAGDPCAGTLLISQMYARVDGLDSPPDWVSDTTVRRVLANQIHSLGRQLQLQANQNGGCQPTGVPVEDAPTRVAILGIRPNPTNASAAISYAIPAAERVTIAVYDLSGRRVKMLVDAVLPAGTHLAQWDGRGDPGGRRLTSGTYFVRLHAGGVTHVKRLVVLK